jgi:hypothetical protein
MAGNTGTKYIRAVVAGIGGQRVSLLFQKQRVDRLSGHRIPAADDVVGAAGEQGAAVRQPVGRNKRRGAARIAPQN